MRRALVLGGGVGGLVAAHRLRQLLPAEDRVVVFERSPVHTFSPSLLWLMTGTRDVDDVVRPLNALRTPGIEVVNAEVERFDPHTLDVRAGGLDYRADALILALGADLDPGQIPGLAEEAGSFYTVAGAQAVWRQIQDLTSGHVVVVIGRLPFKCPAAPYEAAMLLDGYLKRRRRRSAVELSVYAAESAPMSVAGPSVSQAVMDALAQRNIAYHPDHVLERVDRAERRLSFTNGAEVRYDVLAYVAPHVVPKVVVQAGLAAPSGWVAVDRATLETSCPNVFAVGDVTGIPLSMGKPLPKAGVFAERQALVVAETIAARLRGRGQPQRFDGTGECFIEMGGGIAGFARGNFYSEPHPLVRIYRPGRHWHAAKIAFERHWWSRWW